MHLHMYAYVYVYECMYVCMYMCMYVCIYICVCVCVYMYVYMCMHICIYVYICVCICIHVARVHHLRPRCARSKHAHYSSATAAASLTRQGVVLTDLLSFGRRHRGTGDRQRAPYPRSPCGGRGGGGGGGGGGEGGRLEEARISTCLSRASGYYSHAARTARR